MSDIERSEDRQSARRYLGNTRSAQGHPLAWIAGAIAVALSLVGTWCVLGSDFDVHLGSTDHGSHVTTIPAALPPPPVTAPG